MKYFKTQYVVQCLDSNTFLRGSSGWVPDARDANQFNNYLDARDAIDEPDFTPPAGSYPVLHIKEVFVPKD